MTGFLGRFPLKMCYNYQLQTTDSFGLECGVLVNQIPGTDSRKSFKKCPILWLSLTLKLLT